MDQTRCQQQQMSSCLTRFRSAPSSYFDTILNAAPTPPPANSGGGYARDDNMLSAGGSGPNIQQAFARLIATMGGARDSSSCSSGGGSDAKPPLVPPPKQEPEARLQPRQEMKYSSHSQPFSGGDNSYGLMSPVNPGCFAPVKMNTGVSNSNLTRFNSSPAGFFDQFNIKSGTNAAEASFASPNVFKNRVDLSPRHPPSRGMASISETGASAVKEEACSGDGVGGFNEDQTMDESYLSSFPIPSWDDLDLLSDDFLKVTDEKPSLKAKAPDFKNTEGSRSRPPGRLSHHLSLPKSSEELSSILQDSVPCRVRAKRGCATHPRSIAERVRRTRISDRMRKLQELVPNMDKQTNTADMLDLAVDYIKDLEQKVKRLADNRAKCRCSNK
ncbi:PREDICTED: transcription factor bHLH130-like [Ipomoea nil]|uniref:transcription factor bHLH130-like n=1 Tax=Ipomoea nil TaxID=35883 RepID=UPI000901B1B8|nr:PREDICTED: transcription factor bHLH130-like [Ipomoea nil]